MSTEANGTKSPTFVTRVAEIPVVKDTLAQAHSILHSNSYSAKIYDTAEGVAYKVLELGSPIVNSSPVLYVDSVANRSLDIVQDKFPYPFQASQEELIGKARKPADDAFGYAKGYADAAQSKLSATTEQLQKQVTDTSARLKELQDKLAASIPKSSQEAQQAAGQIKTDVTGIAHNLVSELEKLSGNIQAQSKELPAHIQRSLAPVIDKLNKASSDIHAEISRTDVPLTTRATNVLTYTRENSLPALNDAFEAVKNLLSRKATQASEKAEEGADKSKDLVNGH